MPSATSRAPLVNREWLTSRTFRFVAGPSAYVISETFVFHRNGFIVGYSHQNEALWEIVDNGLHILDHHGQVTCRMNLHVTEDGLVVFTGFFRDPMNNYAQTENQHFLVETASDYHTGIQSFDLFDTLVARRCYDPLEVFRIVERKAGVANFAVRRHLVEMAMFGHRPYGIDDIYNGLVSEGTVTVQQAEVLKQMELEEEWDTLFPIEQIVAQVNPDDIIISDMYLPYAFVERLVREKCGLSNKLYLSNYGKHHRTIWPQITSDYKLRMHFGDNPHADVQSPSEFGIASSFVTISRWSPAEEVLHAAGLSAYAHAVRETRLRTFHPNAHVRLALQAQANVNIPLLVVGAFWARHCALALKANKILAAARDCNLLVDFLASAHFARMGVPPVDYVRISRRLCYFQNDTYEAYFRSRLADRNLLLDVVGTGNSLTALIDRTGLGDRVIPAILVGETVEKLPAMASLNALVRREFPSHRLVLEALNASAEGSAADAKAIGHTIEIGCQPNEFTEFGRIIIGEMRKNFAAFMTAAERIAPLDAYPTLDALRAAAEVLVDFLPGEALRISPLLEEQRQNLGVSLTQEEVRMLSAAAAH